MKGPRALPFVLFFGSGLVSLVYEVVWTRGLNVMLGSAPPASATVFAVFLGGLGLGAYAASRRAYVRPLLAYGIVELSLASLGAASPFALHALARALAGLHVEGRFGLLALRCGTAGLLLLPPAALMGATLPLLLRHVSGNGTESLPMLYGLNTVGAVVGCLLAGFVLVATFGERGTLFLAASGNALIALVAIGVGWRSVAPAPGSTRAGGQKAPRDLLVLSFLSGFVTLALEVIWLRILGITVGGSAQALALLLASFLAGLAGGSLALRAPQQGILESYAERMLRVGVMAALLLPASMALPMLLIRLLTLTHRVELIAVTLGVCLAILMAYGTGALGAAYPLLVSEAGRRGVEGSRGAGALYAASALGSIAGSLATAFVIVPRLGLDGASVFTTMVAAIAVFRAADLSIARRIAVGVVLLSAVDPILYRLPAGLFVTGTYAYAYRYAGGEAKSPPAPLPAAILQPYASLDDPDRSKLSSPEPPAGANTWIWRKDGLSASVAVGESAGVRSLLINGKTDASSFGPGDMRTQLLLGHLPALLRRADGGRALVIGLGSGTTLRAIAAHPFSEVIAAEVEPAVVEAAALFEGRGGGVPAGARVVVDDGRQVLARDVGPFDVITSEPSNLWMAGVAHLFTRELFLLAKERLAPGGLFCQWLHLYQIGEDDVKVLLRTLHSVFPRLYLFADGPDLLILAGSDDALAGPALVTSRFATLAVRAHLAFGRFDDLGRVLETYVGDETLVDRFAGEGPLNTDDAPILEFRAPRSLLTDDSARILADLAGGTP